MRKNYALKTFIFVVALIILFIPSNASAYTKQGFAMKKADAKNFKYYINGSAKSYKNIIINGAMSWNVSPYLNTVSMGIEVNPHFNISSSNADKGATVAVCATWTYVGMKVVAKNEITT